MFRAFEEKISFFLRFWIFCCNRQKFGPKTGGGGVYVNDEVLDTGHCSKCGGTPVQLAIAAITTQENINSQICTTQGFPEKQKFSVI